MASRLGPRATGSDGNDFQHREKVASHYQQSVNAKFSIRKSLIPHMLLAVLGLIRLTSVSFVGLQYLPPPEAWESIWLLSGVCAYIGYASLSKNVIGRIIIYIIGNILFGCAPLLYGARAIAKQSWMNYKRNVSFGEWQSFPIKLAIIAVCLQFQIIGLFFGFRLLKAWRATGTKNK